MIRSRTSKPFGRPLIGTSWLDIGRPLRRFVDDRIGKRTEIVFAARQRGCSGRREFSPLDRTTCRTGAQEITLAVRTDGVTYPVNWDPGQRTIAGYSVSSAAVNTGAAVKVWLVRAPGETDYRVYSAPAASGETMATLLLVSGAGMSGIAIAPSGTMGVVQEPPGYVSIRTVTPGGVVSTIVGSPATDVLTAALGIGAVDGTNWVVMQRGASPAAYLVNAGGVTLLAGGNAAGHADGTGAGATLALPGVLCRQSSSEFLFGDQSCVRKLTTAGVVTTISGVYNDPVLTDGNLATARFLRPAGIAVSPVNGHIYVADKTAIREITLGTPGVVATLAGSATSGILDGTGAAAQFGCLAGMAVDSLGNLYVIDSIAGGAPDSPGRMIRKVTPAGVVTTIAGSTDHTNAWSWSIDGTGTDALFAYPQDIACDSNDVLWVADAGAIRRVTTDGVVTTVAGGIVRAEIVDPMEEWSATPLNGSADSSVPTPPTAPGGAFLGFWSQLTTAAAPDCATAHTWGMEYGTGQAHHWVADTDATRWKLWTEGVRRGKALNLLLVEGESTYWAVNGMANVPNVPEGSELCAIVMMTPGS